MTQTSPVPFVLVFFIAVLGLMATACELEEGVPDARDTTSSGGRADTGGGDIATGGMPMTPQYRYVRITDTSGDINTEDAGADIDAVGVRDAATGATMWATTVEGIAGNVLGDTSAVTGAPTAFPNWAQGDVSTCGANADNDGFTSLGGDGAISLSFASTFTTGDVVVVYEVGNCDIGKGSTAREESITIDVAVSSDIASAMWVNIFSDSGSPLIEATIP